jgi:hypothetical protein
MNYPAWELGAFGGGLLIAVIAVVHVFIAHFAVGGGLLLVLTEIKARRLESRTLLACTRRHAGFFLLLTMVGGAVTGVGIWFTIGLLNPAATSVLIHTFVFGWAAEWVCFVGEIVALLVYFYGFERLAARDHLRVGWLYFIFAWLSLFWVNGIIDAMLTPGRWLAGGGFWAGFFNPSMWPALGFRTALALVLAGVFGLLTAVWMTGLDETDRRTLVVYYARWSVLPMVALALCGGWYWQALPADIRAMIAGRAPELAPYLQALWISALILTAGGALALIRLGRPGCRVLTIVLLIISLIEMGAFEFLREGARRPFAIYGRMYANGIDLSQQEAIDREGFLARARWVSRKTIDTNHPAAMGREIFRLQCAACHSVGGPMNDIRYRTRKFTLFGMDAQLDGQGKLLDYMPPFMGTRPERLALAQYIVTDLNHRPAEAAIGSLTPRPMRRDAFDVPKDAYILLAWSDLGMHLLTDCDSRWSLAPPGANLTAQLIKRGENPELVTRQVTLHYNIEADHAAPSRRDAFWQYADKLFDHTLPPDTGLSGARLEGTLQPDETHLVFVTKGLPVVPYAQPDGFDPYPLVTIEAHDSGSGEVLARTQATLPVSTELGCRNCHGGPWRVDGRAGISPITAEDVLSVHDRINHTRLAEQADQGRPLRCQACHGDASQDAPGRPGVLNLSAAVHGWHALYLTQRGAEACHACHPSDPRGATRMLRGIHNQIELSCLNCHGPLEDHALGLLKAESRGGKKSADRLMTLIKPRQSETLAKVPPRTAWYSQPDCLHCHVDFQPPESDETLPGQRTTDQAGLYRMRSDDTGLRCAACHGSPHALYPARNPYGAWRDVIAPQQYQQSPYPMGSNRNCKVCHTVDMQEEIHHPNMLTQFRNTVDEEESRF